MSSPSLVIAAERVIAEQGDLAPGVVEVHRGRIVAVRGGRPPRKARLERGFLAPGLVDLQINGCAGVDFVTLEDPGRLRPVRRLLLACGVTAFLPTLITTPLPVLRRALAFWREVARSGGAPRVIGVHLEGPYLNPDFAGAHPKEHLRTPDPAEFAALLDAAPGLVRLFTLAPELPGAEEVIRAARARRIVLSAGHTGATFEQALRAFRAGVRMVTHLFNAMRPLHHREPGIVGAALAADGVTAGLIADLVHVHPAVVRAAIAAKGWSRIALVTDAVAAAGQEAAAGRPVGTSSLAGQTVTVSDAPRLPSGTLAGSLLTLDRAIRNVVTLGVPVREAVLMASTVPASLLGRRDLGRIAVGARADLVLFDRRLGVRSVYVAGERVFHRARERTGIPSAATE
ncbi:MAG: N-acetylglucosamine-6-phosphate deacetylase [Armatimonadota bacterium]|nr:N-acetylglucosamine-6-phosphate deacetylase [Armatimonadota bacterium]MDR7450742.1 N-acetylglucosamine-6-phosphate deacetylase [Armatimonadota bacterium]MDR7466098.1 N-acetylglucosamine-6-phosphate deacetylase [Armatimonadota bacterium]MDR7493865.1 N-acetylglucosamine-6-phosphate deacetylase [Armatimonadota bacterium]MDR7498974.1 N-acetylglucosamine-6-phosphate deacetylase [Armatimonadota bacterium]